MLGLGVTVELFSVSCEPLGSSGRRSSPMRRVVRGVCGAGFNTTFAQQGLCSSCKKRRICRGKAGTPKNGDHHHHAMAMLTTLTVGTPPPMRPYSEGGLLPRQALEKPNHNKKTTYHDKSPRTNSDKKTASHDMRSWRQQRQR